jgi:hypothetical protein
VSRFRLSSGGGRSPHHPWFRIGTLEVGTTWLVVLLGVAGIVLYAAAGAPTFSVFDGTYGGIEGNLGMDAHSFLHEARFWTLLTWPFAYWSISFFDVVGLFFFWYFGAELERDMLGRTRFAWLLAIWTVALGAIMLAIYGVTGNGYPLTAMPLLEMMVVLLWIAEWPRRMFMFNIPAWLWGVVIVGIQVVSYLGQRQWALLVDFLIGIVVCAFVARQFGLLSEHAWIPKVVGNRPRRRRLRSVPPVQPAPPAGVWPNAPGPWTPPVSQADEDRMNELLEKIHEQGAEALTERERTELNELRLRRRQGR